MPLSRLQPIGSFLGLHDSISLDLLREDELHPLVSGNKFRKLKYNVQAALQGSYPGILTFGGAYSNHLVATAAACAEARIKSIGIVRGEEVARLWKGNPTLSTAAGLGMELHFVSREFYASKRGNVWADWKSLLGLDSSKDYLVLPEGGTNELAIQGCAEILEDCDDYDVVVAAVGTGGTLAGLIRGSSPQQHIIGISALPESGMSDLIRTFTKRTNWEIRYDYHGGRYASITPDLVQFMNTFYQQSGIPLDPVYTAKMLWGLKELFNSGQLSSDQRVLAIHTGGLQGIAGMNQKLEKKQWPRILDPSE
jgi:1-aminocyclopropane-1-carboxylate deaminase